MAVLPNKGEAHDFEMGLVSQANPDTLQANPTFAAGDVTLFGDGAALGNITALPTAIGGGRVITVSLTAAEMNYDRLGILFHDQAGNEWQDRFITLLIGQSTPVFPAGGVTFTYTLTSDATGLPIEGAEIWFSTDVAGVNIVWKGNTDTFGVARDVNNALPTLDAGTYYVWALHPEFTFENPDTEVVS